MWDGPARTIELVHGDMVVTWHREADAREQQGAALNTIGNNGTLDRWFEDEEEIFTTFGENEVKSVRQRP